MHDDDHHVPSPAPAGLERNASRARADATLDGAVCPACRTPIVVGGLVAHCPFCAAAHHDRCYALANGCAHPDCDHIPPPRRPNQRAGPTTNGLAIAALVVGIAAPLACLPAGAIALPLGLRALRQIDADRTQGGRGLAIAGIVLGSVSCLAILFMVVVGVAAFLTR